MRDIIVMYSALFVMLINVASGITTTVAAEKVELAKSYKAEVVEEIENSNFNPVVIDACKSEAQTLGYDLTIESCTYDEEHDIQTAEIVLTYDYKMPLFGIDETRVTRGVAR